MSFRQPYLVQASALHALLHHHDALVVEAAEKLGLLLDRWGCIT